MSDELIKRVSGVLLGKAVVEHQTAEIIKQMKASPNTEALHDEIEQLQLYVRNYVNASFPAPR
jgi:hypothetical protein